MSCILETKNFTSVQNYFKFPLVRIQKNLASSQESSELLSEKPGLARRPQSCDITFKLPQRSFVSQMRRNKAQRHELT